MTAPTLKTVSVSSNSTIVLQFDRAVSAGDARIVISDGYGQTYSGNYGLSTRIVGATDKHVIDADSGQVSYSGQNVTITLSSPLKSGLNYSVTMEEGAISSGMGEGDWNAAISSPKFFNFVAPGNAASIATPSALVGATLHFTDTGSSSSDYVTGTLDQTISGNYTGTLGANDFIQVSLDNGASWHKATVNSSTKTWSYSEQVDEDNLVDGDNGLDGVLLARVGNTAGGSSAMVSQHYTYDDSLSPPSGLSLAGRALALDAESDTGASSTDGITRSASGVTLNVANLHGVHAGDRIEIIDTSNGSAVMGSYVIQASDLYYGDDYFASNFVAVSTFDIALNALSQGDYVLAARIVNVAGEVGAASASSTVVVDKTVPGGPTTTPVNEATSVSTDLSQLTFTFTEDIWVEAGTVITITDDQNPDNSQEVVLQSGAVDGHTLTVELSSALTSGTRYIVKGAAVMDLAGNSGITGDTDMLYFTTAGTYSGGGGSGGGGGPAPETPFVYIDDTHPASDSSLNGDGVTNNNQVFIQGLDSSGTWEYRLSASGDWQPAVTYLILPDGHYQADQIQVRQTVNGVTSDVGTIDYAVTIDTEAFSDDLLTPNNFNENTTSLTGTLSADAELSDQIVEVTLDHGMNWLDATLTPTDATHASWSLAANMENAEAFGLRLSDSAGNVTDTIYYLSSRDSSYNHPDYDDIIVVDGGGLDVVVLGDRVDFNGGGGYGDNVTTGADAKVVVGNDSVVATGGGSNTITTGFGARINNGSSNGDDTISSLSIEGAYIYAGGGDDVLTVRSSETLIMSSLNITGVEHLVLAGSGTNTLTITTDTVVQNFAGGDQLIIDGGNGTTNLRLDSTVWARGADQGDYAAYHSGQGSGSVAVLVGVDVNVTLLNLTA